MDVAELPRAFERGLAALGEAATGHELIELFFALARASIDGYGPVDTDENVVRVEATSSPDSHGISLKRELTQLDGRGDLLARTQFYVDLSFPRLAGDDELHWLHINYLEAPQRGWDLPLDEVIRELAGSPAVQQFAARPPLTVRTWLEGDLP